MNWDTIDFAKIARQTKKVEARSPVPSVSFPVVQARESRGRPQMESQRLFLLVVASAFVYVLSRFPTF